MDFSKLFKRKIKKIRNQSIRVFCFHHVSDSYEESTMERCDWLPTDVFKLEIAKLKSKGYTFISLSEADLHLKSDVYRFRKYAVLTADDGWVSLNNILPWLDEQQIPITLFLNPAYLNGKQFRKRETEQYLSMEEVCDLHRRYPLLSIGSHGWEHIDVTQLNQSEFLKSVDKANEILQALPNYIPFYAFTYGRYKLEQLNELIRLGYTPVLVDGRGNYDYTGIIERELLCADFLKKKI